MKINIERIEFSPGVVVAQTEKPIFIVGVHRSGTTLLRYMLNSHPDIYIPPESDFIPRFFLNNPNKKLSEREIEKILINIFSKYRFVKEWQGNPPDIRNFTDSERTPDLFLSKLYQLYAQQYNAIRWGDKTPIYSSYINLIEKIFPDAQFIHIIRDGRDVALSMLEKWQKKDFHIDIYFAAQNWVRRINKARKDGILLGEHRYLELRYEDLVNNPVTELKNVCKFLGETYFPIMSQPNVLGSENIEPGSFHDPIRYPPSTARINRWKHEMSQADLRIFQRIAGNLLTELGYSILNSSEFSIKEQLRYYCLAAKYYILQTSRSILQALRIMPPI
jgi:hypothetical protein